MNKKELAVVREYVDRAFMDFRRRKDIDEVIVELNSAHKDVSLTAFWCGFVAGLLIGANIVNLIYLWVF